MQNKSKFVKQLAHLARMFKTSDQRQHFETFSIDGDSKQTSCFLNFQARSIIVVDKQNYYSSYHATYRKIDKVDYCKHFCSLL